MLLNLLQGNLPRVELGVRMATSDCHRSESDVADSKEEDLPPPPTVNPAARPRLPDWPRC
eukprot:7720736-Pyramimonas_sp.AAC.1